MHMRRVIADTKNNACLIKFDRRDTGEADPAEPTESIQREPGSGTSEVPLY